MKNLIVALSAIGLIAASAPSLAGAPCHDAKGKFVKCTTRQAPPRPARCRDSKGKYAKCGTPGTRPA